MATKRRRCAGFITKRNRKSKKFVDISSNDQRVKDATIYNFGNISSPAFGDDCIEILNYNTHQRVSYMLSLNISQLMSLYLLI